MGAVYLPAEYALSIRVLTIVMVWAAIFAVCYGVQTLKAARFPFLFSPAIGADSFSIDG